MTIVGIVVPAHNPGPLLRRALDSVLGQTHPDWRAVIVDDGSAQDLGWVSTLDQRVSLLRQPNGGVSRARNVGVARLETDLIAFLDQDDEWAPRKLELQIAALSASPDAAFCHTEFTWVLPDGPIPGRHPQRITYYGLLAYQHILLSSLMLRRERYLAVGGHDPLLAMVQDYDLYLRLTMDGSRPVCVQEPLVRYHVHAGNASRDYRRAHEEGRRVIAAHATLARRNGDQAALRAAAVGTKRTRELYADQALQSYRRASADGRPVAGIGDLGRALAWNPSTTIASIARSVTRRRDVTQEALDTRA